MLGLMHDHPYVFTPTIAKIMLPEIGRAHV